MTRTISGLLSLLALLAAASAAHAQGGSPLAAPKPTAIRGAHYPAFSPDGRRLAFSYLGDLWTVPTEGGTAARLTQHLAYDAHPKWSPDGNWIAFSSKREGNLDVFLVPARGGAARQMTFHGADDTVQDWSPDGTKLLFASARDSRYTDLYLLSIEGSRLKRLTRDRTASRYACFSTDGKRVLYTRGRQDWMRPKYKGSATTDLYSIPVEGGKATRVTTYEGFDAYPLTAREGGKEVLYFVSDRGGASNLYAQRPGGEPVALTAHKDDPVRFPAISRNGAVAVYEQGFRLWTLPLTPVLGKLASAPKPVEINAPADLLFNWTQRLNLTNGATALAVSGDGRTLAFTARGELWTVPSTGGDAVRVTKTGAAEVNPAWAPQGDRVAFSTDRHGNLDIYVTDTKTKQERQITTDLADDDNPRFSPSGHLLAFIRRGGSEPGLYVKPTAETGDPRALSAVRVGPGHGISVFDWSPDSRWLVYAKRDATSTADLWIVPAVGGTPINVTRYPGTNTNPQWSRDGRHIVFRSNRGGAPGDGLNVYALPLLPEPTGDAPGQGGAAGGAADLSGAPVEAQAPLPAQAQAPAAAPQGGGPQGAGLPPFPPARPPDVVRIEFPDIHNRARALTSTRTGVGAVTLSPDGRTAVFQQSSGSQNDWFAVDIASGGMARLTVGAPAGGTAAFAPDASRFYTVGPGGTILQVARQSPSASPVAFRAAMELDRRVEIAEAFNEAWRSIRTRFYDPTYHGLDWQAIRAKYEALLPEVAAKEDFAWLLNAMVGELNASHTGATPPEGDGPTVETGYLGMTFDEGHAGPGIKVGSVLPKGPADQIGRRIAPGEFILAVDGQDVVYNEPFYQTLADKAARTVELLVNEKPVKEGARTVRVRPISQTAWADLEYDAWVESRRRKVEQLSGGRLAYIHIRAMNQVSLQKFQREIFGDAQGKEGLVLDVRFNGGGRIHDELLGILTRKPHVFETPRDGERSPQPFQVWAKPTILLINEYSSSDAEIFPNGFRENRLGKIVGVPTFGGVIGTVDITLVDGTVFRVPGTGWETLAGKNLENWGVPPDIRVEHSPGDNAEDNDRQLETAVRELLKELGK